MDNANRISIRCYTIIVIFVTIGTSILIAPSGLAIAAKQDAWLAGIVGSAVNILLVALYAAVGERYPELNLAQCIDKLLGKWVGAAVTLGYTVYFFFLGSLMIGSMGFFMTTQLLQDTPVEALMILFVLVVVIALKSGSIVYARAVEIFFPLAAALLVILLFCLLPILDPSRLLPVYEFGAKPILRGAYSFYSLQNSVLLMMLYPHVAKGKGRRRALVGGTLAGNGVLVVLTLLCIMMLGPEQTGNNVYPTYLLAKNVSIGGFLERLEGALIFIWILTIFVRILIVFQATIGCASHVLRLRDENILIWPVMLAGIVMALMCYSNMVVVQESVAKSWSTLSLLPLVLLPLLLYFVSLVRAKPATQDA
ncbi:endospore germination permease [Paenibacillus sp. MWE-103]|uniref:Endospore germination permease n=1 Tax=Paenibacillus artemisiicola TaxID=1172618 RepID=A0ABS3W3S1_9BACL|nr:endospore germination permease [Paenibacillus artemisiicola]MBO7742959.1 endospore germination permease [Paenibacillus artemisiicola]